MPTYIVTQRRTQTFETRVEAPNPDKARERATGIDLDALTPERTDWDYIDPELDVRLLEKEG